MAATVGIFAAASLNGTVVPDLEDSSWTPGLVLRAPEQDGQPTKQIIVDQAPSAMLKSSALATYLALNSSKFFTKGVALSSTGFAGYVPDSATDAAKGTTGTKYAVANGILVPESIEADQDSASITMRVHGRSSDGATAPVAITTAQALPAFSTSTVFALGRCEYNGTNITWAQSIRIAMNLEVKRIKGDGSIYSSKLAVVAVRPAITLTIADQELASTLTVLGTRVSSATHIHFRAFDAAATRVATATASHIQLSIAGTNGLVAPGDVRPNAADTALLDVTYYPIWDGTNEQVTVTTGVAYS